MAVLKNLEGGSKCAFVCVCVGFCQLSRDLKLAFQLATLGQFLLLLKWGLQGLKAWMLAGPGSAAHSGCGTQGASVDCHILFEGGWLLGSLGLVSIRVPLHQGSNSASKKAKGSRRWSPYLQGLISTMSGGHWGPGHN